MIELKFEGIDDWNRPIFKSKNNERYGDVCNLFSWDATFEQVIEKVTIHDICYFGKKFGCEPMGTAIDTTKFKLVKEFSDE